jgi:ABC-type glycerol-3-phosphate transport system permease component
MGEKTKKKGSISYAKWGYIFIAPFFLIFAVFQLIPLASTIYYSFFEYYRSGLKIIGPNFVGLKNYATLFATDLPKYFSNTLLLWIIGFIPQIAISLLLAAWFTDLRLKLKGQTFFKTVIYMPNLIMASAFAMLFFALFSDNGPVNAALMGMGILKQPFSFLNTVWGNRGLIGLMNFLMWFGNTTIMLMAAIMGVDPTLYEAAELDGCTPNQMFWKITIPLIRPILVYVMITSMIGGLQMFDVPQILTNGKGGPDRTSTTMIMYLNNHLFSKNYGMAGAVCGVVPRLRSALRRRLREPDQGGRWPQQGRAQGSERRKEVMAHTALTKSEKATLAARRTGCYIALVLISFLCLFFFYVLVINSTRTHFEIQKGFSLLPGKSLMTNLTNVLNDANIPVLTGVRNSLIVSACSAALSVYFSALTAYGIYAYNFRFKKAAFAIILLIMTMPTQVSALGFLQLITKMGLKNSFLPLIIPSIAAPAVFFFMKQYLDASLPMEIVEAARIDGAGEFYTFNKIVLPIMKPALAVQAIFAFVSSWNNYFIPALVLDTADKKTLPILIAQLRSADFLKFDMGKVYMMVAIAILPVIIVYLLLSKFIVRGVALGGVKG